MVKKMKGFLSAAVICLVCSLIFIGIGYLYISASLKETENKAEKVPYYTEKVDSVGVLFELEGNKSLIYLDFENSAVTYVNANEKKISNNMCCGYSVDYTVSADYSLIADIIDRLGGIEFSIEGKRHNYMGVQVREIIEKTPDITPFRKQIAKAIFEKISLVSFSRNDFAFIIENSSTDLTVPDIFYWEKYIKETCKKAYFVN